MEQDTGSHGAHNLMESQRNKLPMTAQFQDCYNKKDG